MAHRLARSVWSASGLPTLFRGSGQPTIPRCTQSPILLDAKAISYQLIEAAEVMLRARPATDQKQMMRPPLLPLVGGRKELCQRHGFSNEIHPYS